MSALNRTNFELMQRIAALPPIVRAQMTEILEEMMNGSTQREFSTSALTATTLNSVTTAELAVLDGATAGSAVASKALVASPNLDITGLRTVGLSEIRMATNTAVATGGAATLAKNIGKITTEALTTAGQVDYTLTLTNTEAAAADYCFVSVANGTNTQGTPVVSTVVTSANTVTIKINNAHASQALNGTLVISFMLVTVA